METQLHCKGASSPAWFLACDHPGPALLGRFQGKDETGEGLVALQPLRPGTGRARSILGLLNRLLACWLGQEEGRGRGCPSQCQGQAGFMNLNFLLSCRGVGA